MKVLIISHQESSANKIVKILDVAKIDADVILASEEDEFLELVKAKSFDYEFFIFDKFLFELDNYIDVLNKKICFFITENYQQVRLKGFFKNDFKFRFYFSPTNYTLLVVDIKSSAVMQNLSENEILFADNLELNLSTRTLKSGDKIVYLKNKEFELMKYLIVNRGKVLTRLSILENVWDLNATINTNTVDVHVSRLRSLINKLEISDPIKTVQCIGYLLI